MCQAHKLARAGDVKKHLMALQDIASNTTDKNRAAGTIGYNRSLEYVREQLEATGFYDIHEQVSRYLPVSHSTILMRLKI